MKQIKLITILVAMFANISLIMSCGDNEDEIKQSEEKDEEKTEVTFGMSRKLNKICYLSYSGGLEEIFSYDCQNRVVKIETPRYNEQIIYQYENNMILKIDPDRDIEYTYFIENNKITSMTEDHKYYINKYTYSYGDNGQVIYVENHELNTGDGETKSDYLKLNWSKGNITYAEQTDKGHTYQFYYKYDDIKATCHLPFSGEFTAYIFEDWIDSYLVAEGYFGNSLPLNYPTEIITISTGESQLYKISYEMDLKGYIQRYSADSCYSKGFLWE